MAKKFSDFQQRIKSILQDSGVVVSSSDQDVFLQQAITQRYSKDRAREVVTDSVADGTSDLALPSAQGLAFDEGFSRITQVEYPVGDVPASLLDQDEDWTMYRTPAALKVRFVSSAPSNGKSVRFTWTVAHKEDGSTVPASDFDAVCDYAASLCLAAAAVKAAQIGDSTIGADSVNYRTKSQEYSALAKTAAKRYFDHMGVGDGSASGAASVGPAVSIGVSEETMGFGGDRLIHRRR